MIDFRQLVTTLKAHRDIWVAREQILPGASPEMLQKAETCLGAPLHPEVKAFFAHHNGLAIEWMFKHTDRYQSGPYKVDTSELPFWMDLMTDYGHPYDAQIIVAPIEEIFMDNYNEIKAHSDFAPAIAYMEYIELPEGEEEGRFTLGDRQFKSETAFRSQLRIVDYYTRDIGNLMLLEHGKSDPDLFHLEDHWNDFNADLVLPLSKYLHHIAYNFGLRFQRYLYFRRPSSVPLTFDLTSRLEQLIAETKFPGDLR